MTMNSSRTFELVKGELVICVIVKEVESRGEEKEEGGGLGRQCGQSGIVVDNTTQWSSKTVVQLIGLHHTSSSHPSSQKKKTYVKTRVSSIMHYALALIVAVIKVKRDRKSVV